jgi:nucleotidyltransferase/DNA polymerase involved in DNA repair
MQLTDVRIDRFGSLWNTAVDNLSRRITVLYGAHDSGKSTFVRFLRELLWGSPRSFNADVPRTNSESGMIRVSSGAGVRNVRRSWAPSGLQQFIVTDEQDRSEFVVQDNQLPAWVTADVYREVFAPGFEEAARFGSLTRLCLETRSATDVSDIEFRQSEAALLQTVRDRDGNGVQGGVVHHISELRRRQGELQSEIALLRKPAADLPGRIEQLLREIETLTVSIDRTDLRLREIDAEIARLELLLPEIRRRNVLPLNRLKLEEDIRALTTRLDRWKEIRTQISREVDARRVAGSQTSAADEDVRSIRAIVSRLEDRVTVLTDRLNAPGSVVFESGRDADLARIIRGEVAALCRYLGHHEKSVAGHFSAQELRIAERTLTEATEMERLLEQQIASLRADLARSENILVESVNPQMHVACDFVGHRESLGSGLLAGTELRSAAEIENQLQQLRAERSRLISERAVADGERTSKRSLLERLRLELAGAASLEQLDALRAQIAGLDAEIALLEDQRRQLDRAEVSLREVMERLKGRNQSRVFELASLYAQRLSLGEVQRVSAVQPDRLLLNTLHHIDPQTPGQLSQETRDAAALALRLALIQVRRETHGHVPLILDEVLIPAEEGRLTAAARLLSELAQAGQQVIVLTSRKDARDVFARMDADVRPFASRIEVPVVLPPEPPAPLHAYVEPVVEVKRPMVEPIVYLQPAPVEPVAATPTNWLFYLEVDHGVEDLAGITLGELEALRSAGVLTIDDLLSRTVPQLEEAARHKGFLLSVDRLHALRGQAELTTRVPMLRRSDAALLFASGITTVEELSRLRPETVYDRVSDFQRSEAGSRFRRGGRLIDRQQSINWARFGQFARSLDDARQSRSRFSVKSTPRSLAHAAVDGAVATAASPEGDTLRLRKRKRVVGDLNSDERRARREARRKRQVSRQRSAEPVAVNEDSVPAERTGGMRFFLSRTSEVEKAPSIGPRTAQMMESIGVRTIEDLLSMAPDRLAEKLNHRRITPSVIQQWQAQSRLMCQIPELRGHDAQILVACRITTPENLASAKPAELFAVVEPFSRSKEGERIIRNGRKPDLAEVTEWIQWAANARSLKAA